MMGEPKNAAPRPDNRFAAGKGARRATLLFIALVLAAALGLLAWQHAARAGAASTGLVAKLEYGEPAERRTIPLDTDKTYEINTGSYTIHLQVKAGAIAFVQSPCPDHTCEGFGWLSKEGDWAACLPAKALVTIETEQP